MASPIASPAPPPAPASPPSLRPPFRVSLPTPSAAAIAAEAEVHLITDEALADEAVREVHEEAAGAEQRVLGIDTEWAGESRRDSRVALLQLAGPRTCVLLRAGLGCEAVRRCLADARVVKCGVSVGIDARLLKEQFGIECVSALDLNAVVRRGLAGPDISTDAIGLRRLAEAALGAEISKDPALRCGDWAAPELSVAQLEYAALDAVASRAIAVELFARGSASSDFQSWCTELLDTKEKIATHCSVPRQQAPVAKGAVLCSGYTGVQLFTNHIVFDSEGRPMRHMREKTLRSLARQGKAQFEGGEDGSPQIVRLNFTPLDRYADMGDEKTDRNNCVGCGAGDVARCYVIPRQFFLHLPLAWKASNCHDVVLLCPRCRARLERPAADRAEALLADFGCRKTEGRFGSRCANEAALGPEESMVMARSKALLKHRRAKAGVGPFRYALPDAKVEEFEAIVRDYIGSASARVRLAADGELTDTTLESCSDLAAGPTPAQLVVEAITARADGELALLEWVKGWRGLFLSVVEPSFLPESWSADFDVALAYTSSLQELPSSVQSRVPYAGASQGD